MESKGTPEIKVLIEQLDYFHNSNSESQIEAGIPDNPILNHPYYFTNSSLENLDKKYSNGWIHKSRTRTYFNNEGRIVHLNGDKFCTRKSIRKLDSSMDVSRENIYVATSLRSRKSCEFPPEKCLDRVFTEMKKLDDKYSIVVCEFYESNSDKLISSDKRRKRNSCEITAGPDQPESDSNYPSSEVDRMLEVNSVIEKDKSEIQDIAMKRKYSSLRNDSEDSDTSNGRVYNKIEKTEDSECDPSYQIGKTIKNLEYLGPVDVLSSKENYFIGNDDPFDRNTLWKNLKMSFDNPQEFLSRPYIVQNRTAKTPFIMFYLKNYSYEQFMIQMKLLDCDLNNSIRLPCKFHMEMKMKMEGNIDKYTDPVSQWFVCSKLGECSLQLLVPFPDEFTSYKHLQLCIIVKDFIEV